jgi:hypothetical protein
MMTVLFTTTSLDRAPQMGLGLAAVLTLIAGMISMLRLGAQAAASEEGLLP